MRAHHDVPLPNNSSDTRSCIACRAVLPAVVYMPDDGLHQQVRVDFSFDQIVAGAVSHGFQAHFLPGHSGEDNDGHLRHFGVHTLQCIQIFAVGQVQIQQDDIVPLVDASAQRQD